MTKRRWARYVRVSRVGDRGGDSFISPEIQQKGIRDLIRNAGGTAGPEFEDLDRTGRDFNRDGIQAAIAWVMEDPARRGLATYDVSRLGRNTAESLRVVTELRDAGAVYGSHLQRIDDTPEGNLALTMWLGMAQHQSDSIGRAWRSVHESRAARGLPHGALPVGYDRVDGKALPNAEADSVRAVFDAYARGETIRRVASMMSAIRGNHVPPQNLKRVLANEFYRGQVRHRGEFVPGAHKAIIPERLWERVQFRLREEAGQPAAYANPISLLTGLLRCGECGGTVQVVNKGQKRPGVSCVQWRKRYAEDRTCERGIGAPRLDTIEEMVWDALRESCKPTVTRPSRRESNLHAVRVEQLETEVAELRAGRSRLTSALARGALSDEAFDAAVSDLERDLEALSRDLDAARTEAAVSPADDSERRSKVLSWLAVFAGLPASEGRALLREVVREIQVHRFTDEEREELGIPTGRFAGWAGYVDVVWR